jgi:hypothetical protein
MTGFLTPPPHPDGALARGVGRAAAVALAQRLRGIRAVASDEKVPA